MVMDCDMEVCARKGLVTAVLNLVLVVSRYSGDTAVGVQALTKFSTKFRYLILVEFTVTQRPFLHLNLVLWKRYETER
eukprot:SAG31_NODE_969_length_10677_cov_7.080072_12_plen_78_part_00